MDARAQPHDVGRTTVPLLAKTKQNSSRAIHQQSRLRWAIRHPRTPEEPARSRAAFVGRHIAAESVYPWFGRHWVTVVVPVFGILC
jgi:hypothetical protein